MRNNGSEVCPVCLATAGLEFHQDLRHCARCDHLFQWPATITAKYDAAYLAKYAAYPTKEISYLRVGFVRAFVDGGRLLDVGCGRGDFVRAARAAGFDASGYDIHGQPVGAPMVERLDDASPWGVVTFFDSLEHFDDLRPVRELVRRTAAIIVACPFRPATFPANREWKHYRPGEHLHYFSAASLARLFSGHRLIMESNVEDAVRGKRARETNIATYVFKR